MPGLPVEWSVFVRVCIFMGMCACLVCIVHVCIHVSLYKDDTHVWVWEPRLGCPLPYDLDLTVSSPMAPQYA